MTTRPSNVIARDNGKGGRELLVCINDGYHVIALTPRMAALMVSDLVPWLAGLVLDDKRC